MPPKYLAEMLSPPPRHLYKSTPLYLLPTRKEKREATRHCTHHHLLPRDRHGAPRPALGRHGGRAAAGLRPRQAPQHRRRRDRRAGRSCAVGRRGWPTAWTPAPAASREAPPYTTGW
uniref:Uncharacterized protein n=1 Tax=Oryza rufipogon TaxID=4529 RepID=A0A0E0QRW0_ORYRU